MLIFAITEQTIISNTYSYEETFTCNCSGGNVVAKL